VRCHSAVDQVQQEARQAGRQAGRQEVCRHNDRINEIVHYKHRPFRPSDMSYRTCAALTQSACGVIIRWEGAGTRARELPPPPPPPPPPPLGSS
jgi:hypothetical protein